MRRYLPRLMPPPPDMVPDVAGRDVLPALEAERKAQAEVTEEEKEEVTQDQAEPDAEEAAKEEFKAKLRSLSFVNIPRAAR